jgi:hypothetical protein
MILYTSKSYNVMYLFKHSDPYESLPYWYWWSNSNKESVSVGVKLRYDTHTHLTYFQLVLDYKIPINKYYCRNSRRILVITKIRQYWQDAGRISTLPEYRYRNSDWWNSIEPSASEGANRWSESECRYYIH